MISRRKLFGWLAAGALIAPELLSAHRKIFLPPRGGWPHGRLAALIIPPDHAWMWEAEIAAGQCEYDSVNEVMTLLKRSDPVVPESREWASTPLVVPLNEFGDTDFYVSGTMFALASNGSPVRARPISMAADDPVMRAKAAVRAAEIRERLGWV